MDLEITHWTIGGTKASCTELHPYCSHAKYGGGVKQVCPATCGVCSGGCADGCGWTKKWPCPEDATEKADDVCFNLCCMSFKPPMPPWSWNRPSGFVRCTPSLQSVLRSLASWFSPRNQSGLPGCRLRSRASSFSSFCMPYFLFSLSLITSPEVPT